MIVHRHWIALLIAGGLCGVPVGRAQDDAGSSDAGASSSFGSGDTSSSGGSSVFDTAPAGSISPFGSLFDTGATPSTSTATPSVFGTNPTGTAPPASGAPQSSSTFGSGPDFGTPAPPREEAPSFTMPGAYGQSSQTFTLGEGRLARPRFEFSATLTTGYDDNTLQTPTKTQEIPEIVQQDVLVDPGTPDVVRKQTVFVPFTRIIDGIPVRRFRPVEVDVVEKGRPPEFEDIVLQERIPARERVGSFFTRASAAGEVTFATRRTIFTMDARGNADYYFSRPEDQLDLTGSIAFSYLYRITPRMQFSASASLAYLSQPDVRLLNGPTQNVGDYFSGTSKFDLSYRWTKRFSTVTSFSFNSLLYSQAVQQTGDFYQGIVGTEGRYAWSPRLTLLGEVRYGQIVYPNSSLLDSNTIYLLLGGEYALTRRISTSLRIGESIRSFEEAGGTDATPYVEASTSWRYSPRGFLSLNTRFGFEESGSADVETQSLRVGLSATHAFSARLRGNLGVTYVHQTSTSESTGTDSLGQTFDLNMGFDYAFSKRVSFNGSYVFTTTMSDTEINDYYRNRIFLGLQFKF